MNRSSLINAQCHSERSEESSFEADLSAASRPRDDMVGIYKTASRGMALALVLLCLFVMSVLGFALAGRGIQNLFFSSNADADADAFYAAQAGVARAIYAVEKSDSALPSACTCTSSPSCSGAACTNSPSFSGGNTLLDGATFSLNITYNGSSSTFPVTASDQTLVPPSSMYVVSTGSSGTTSKYGKVMLNVTTAGWPYQFSLFGKIAFNYQSQGLSDSYNSTTGAYSSSKCNGVHCQGNIGTNNSTGSPHVIVASGGPMDIWGNVLVGAGGTYATVTAGTSGATYHGTTGAQTTNVALSIPADPLAGSGSAGAKSYSANATLPPGKYDAVTISGGTLTLQPGIYSIQSLTISGSGKVDVSSASSANPVKVYTSGPVNISTSSSTPVVSPNQIAGRLLINGTNTGSANTWTWNVVDGGLSAAIDAPNSNINASFNGNSSFDVYGSVVTSQFNFNGNFNVHYDTALTTDAQAGGAQTVAQESWLFQ